VAAFAVLDHDVTEPDHNVARDHDSLRRTSIVE
jgi:hypothetical protein